MSAVCGNHVLSKNAMYLTPRTLHVFSDETTPLTPHAREIGLDTPTSL